MSKGYLNYKALLFCVVLMGMHILVNAQSNTIECKQVEDIARMEMEANEQKLNPQFYKKTASELIDVHYHRCEWNINPNIRAIAGSITTYFTNKTNTDKVVFDLSNSLLVDTVFRNGQSLRFLQIDNEIIIYLGFLLPAQSLDSLRIVYHGSPSNTGYGSFVASSHNGTPVIWTLSAPYGARDWWPCKNTLDDKIDSIDVIISCPSEFKGISNGKRKSEITSTDGTQRITHWQHRYPIASYLICLAVTNYQEFNDSVQLGNVTLPMQTFCYPESFDVFKKGTYAVLDAMKLFHNNFGDYPFIKEKYGHTQFGWGGGMEHQTNSFMLHVGESLSAHELAHQWFGDKITCGSWQDIWLNEGFATHLASIYMEQKYKDSVLVWRKREIDQITQQSSGSVKVDDTLNVNRIFNNRLTYVKGSHLLYMLRFKLGDDVFFKAIKAYQSDPKIVHGFAKTNDLKRNLEQVSGVSLDSFFRQCFEGQGYPSYKVQWTQIGNGTVKIKMGQTTSHTSVPFFELPVALKFKNASREKTVVVDFKTNNELFIRDIGFIADTVIVDPEYWLISKNNTSQKLSEIDPPKLNLLVYPNPFKQQFSVQISNFKGAAVSLAMHDAAGRLVFQKEYMLYKGKEFITIPTEHLASGTYRLTVLDETNIPSVISLLKD